jgi:hypothetical protein
LASIESGAQNIAMVAKDALDQEIEAKLLELEKVRARAVELQVDSPSVSSAIRNDRAPIADRHCISSL